MRQVRQATGSVTAEAARVLQQSFGFTEEDLQANRTGRFSQSQHNVLMKQYRNGGCFRVGIGVLYAAIFGAIFLFALGNGIGKQLMNPSTAPVIIGSMVFVVLLVGGSLLFAGRLRPPEKMELKQEQGVLSVETHPTYDPGTDSGGGGIDGFGYSLVVNSRQFPVMKTQRGPIEHTDESQPEQCYQTWRKKLLFKGKLNLPPYRGFLSGLTCCIYYVEYKAGWNGRFYTIQSIDVLV